MTKLIHIAPILILLIAFSGCKPKTSSEAEINKLLERQSELLEVQDESIDEMQQLKDSLEEEKLTLIGQRDRKDQRIKQMEKNQQLLVDQLKQEETKAVSSEKSRLQESLERYEDSISELKNELASLDHELDSIETRIELYRLQESKADEMLASGISEVDQQITRLEKQKRQELKNADLLRRRIEIAEKKIEAYGLERKMYIDRRDELLRIKASEEQLFPFREKIVEMDSIISHQQDHINDLNRELDQSMQWISEADSMKNDMQAKIEQEYDRNQIIEGFIASEKQRLGKELENLYQVREKLLSEQKTILAELAGTETEIASLNKKLELIRNKDMSDVLDLQAALERSEADLAQEEIRLLYESARAERRGVEMTSDSTSDEFQSVIALSNQLDSLKALIQEEKTGTVRARMELSEKKALAADQRARFSRTMGLVVLALVLAGIALLTFFYYLGRRARTSS
jgi:chromosome segregation ATPase